VLSYFCGDDTLSIFEPPQRNTGMTGGRYLERARVSDIHPPLCNRHGCHFQGAQHVKQSTLKCCAAGGMAS
jgi:DUF1126 PH-like domain